MRLVTIHELLATAMVLQEIARSPMDNEGDNGSRIYKVAATLVAATLVPATLVATTLVATTLVAITW